MQFFRYVNSKLKTRSRIADLHAENGVDVTEDAVKAEMFNRFFSSVFTREDLERIPEVIKPTDQAEHIGLSSVEVHEGEVLDLLKRLQPDKSPGPDGMHPRVLKECAAELAHPITLLFKASLKEGTLPVSWKDATVTPIFKKGSRMEVGNYRPVSLTSVCCKLLEKIVRKSLLRHMIDNGYLSEYQHGFVQGRSCTTQLLKVMDMWTDILDQGGAIDAAYLDFAKAFDTVPHQRLLRKLEGYGVTGKLLDWFGDFLLGRRQRVGVAGSFSGWSQVISGVPEGSVLGPLMFVCYINDLPETIASFIFLYADDTKVFRRVDCELDRDYLQHDLDQLAEWARKWQLRFNIDKCKILHLGGARNRHETYSMIRPVDGMRENLRETTEEKDLGVWMDCSAKPSVHVNHAVNKANQLLGLIRRGFTYMDCELMKQLFTSIVRPHLEYANIVWHPYLRSDIELIEKVQHRATRMVPGMSKLTYEDRLKRFDLPTLVYRRARGDAIDTYK